MISVAVGMVVKRLVSTAPWEKQVLVQHTGLLYVYTTGCTDFKEPSVTKKVLQ